MPGEFRLPGLPEQPRYQRQEFESLAPIDAVYFATPSVDTDLWLDVSELGPEVYAADRVAFNNQLADYIQTVLSDPRSSGLRLADIMTSQYVLEKPVVSKQQLAALAEQLAQGFLGTDSLIVLAGFFSKDELRLLLSRIPENPVISLDSIRKNARNIDNHLSVEPLGGPADFSASALLHETVEASRQSGNVEEFGPNGTGKLFVRATETDVEMVRRMPVENFAAWLRAYEAEQVWGQLGFDHIPVEPIHHFKLDGQFGSVDCRTTLLNSHSYLQALDAADTEITQDIARQAQNIKRGLDRIGINHGHLHADNLQVVTSETGPKVYAIDFDKALIARDYIT